MNKILKYTVWALLVLCYYLVYTHSLSHIIAHHEQHHLFLFTKAYFEQQVHSAGIFSYLTDFIIQFFHYPELGSVLLAVLIASVYLLTHHPKAVRHRRHSFIVGHSILATVLSHHGSQP